MAETTFQISKDLSLPLSFVTQTQAILARKGSGKSYTASVQAEELMKTGSQIVVIDVTGAWWGLRSSSSGTQSGYPIVVAGGEHGDIPLEEGAGEVMAEAIVSERFSCILDISLFRKAAAHRFLAPFLEALYRKNREAVHLFADEADFYAPQKPFGEEARTLGAMSDVVRRGRIRGIGCTLITQRAAVLNKDVLTQCEMLTVLKMSHHRDIGAIKEWVDVHGDPGQARKMIAELPSLPIGTAWVWAPGWPDAGGIFQRIKVRRRETFDSGATPKAGQAIKSPKVLAAIDVERLGETIRQTVAKAQENNPKALKVEIQRLRQELVKAQNAKKTETVEVPVISDTQIKWIEQLATNLKGVATSLLSELDTVGEAIRRPTGSGSPAIERKGEKPAPVTSVTRPMPASHGTSSKALSGGERKILTVLAQYPEGRTKKQVALLTGYAHNGGGFGNYLSSLRSRGLITGGGDRLQATDEGVDALGDFEPLPTGEDLQRYWLEQLSKAEREVLTVLIDAYPNWLTKEEIADRTPSGYEPTGGGFGNALSRLRTLELIEGRGEMKANDTLFE